MSVITLQLKTMRLKENDTKLISIGGFDARKKVFEVFNIHGKSNTVYPDLPDDFYFSKALKLGKCIYNMGGSLDPNFEKVTNKVHQLNLSESKLAWKEICPMNEERSSMGAAVFCNCLIAAGGASSEEKRLQSSEVYISAFKKWQHISSMNIARSSMELVACDDCLYALGGYDGKESLNSMERMVDLDGEWEFMESMNVRRSLFAAKSYKDKIYVFGGSYREEFGGMFIVNSPEIYSPGEKQWTVIATDNLGRYGHAACVLSDKIYVVGGVHNDAESKSTKCAKSIACYDPIDNKVTIVDEIKVDLARHTLVAL